MSEQTISANRGKPNRGRGGFGGRGGSRSKADPLIHDLLNIEGVSGFVKIARERNFMIDYSGYVQLIRTSYDSQMAFDRAMGKYVPFCAYQYYCIIALWKRLFDVVNARGLHTLEHLQISRALDFDLPLPTDIQIYLTGIGDIRDSSGHEFHLELQSALTDHSINGIAGGFGKIDHLNHIIYETLPSPLVSVLKMQADLAEGQNLDWDLPAELRPENAAAQLPTENLLTWRSKERLTEDQRTTLEEAGVTLQDPNVSNIGRLPIFRNLLRSVAARLENSTCKAISLFPKSTTGSQAQIAYISRSPDDAQVEPFRIISAKLGRTNSYVQAVSGIASSSAIMRYRIQRSTANEMDSICYRFQANAIPHDWLANVNQIFDHGIGSQLWNQPRFGLSEMYGKTNYASFSNRVRCKVTRD